MEVRVYDRLNRKVLITVALTAGVRFPSSVWTRS